MNCSELINNALPMCFQRTRAAGASVMILIVFLTGLGGCGIKAPPVPPQRRQAPPVVDLNHKLDGDVLSLTWRLPDADRGCFAAAEGCRVYRARSVLAGSSCPGCPPNFEPVAEIPVAGGSAAGTRMQYSETLAAGFGYIYKVACFADSGIAGEDSDWVTLSY